MHPSGVSSGRLTGWIADNHPPQPCVGAIDANAARQLDISIGLRSYFIVSHISSQTRAASAGRGIDITDYIRVYNPIWISHRYFEELKQVSVGEVVWASSSARGYSALAFGRSPSIIYRHLTFALGSLPHDDLQARFQG